MEDLWLWLAVAAFVLRRRRCVDEDEDADPKVRFGPRAPRSARWLAAARQEERRTGRLPHHLRQPASGLRPLRPDRWLEVDGRLALELRLKQRLLAPGKWQKHVVAAEPGSQRAQRRALDLVLDALEQFHVRTHRVLYAAGERVGVEVLGQAFLLADYEAHPLALAASVLQEDFILLRPDGEGFAFCAGAACFAFSEVGLRGERWNMALGGGLGAIHDLVPGFCPHLLGRVTQALQALTTPQWRANWSLAPSGALTPFAEDGDPERYFSRTGTQGVVYAATGPPEDLWLKVEHQTIHKVGEHVLFTVRTYCDPVAGLGASECGRLAKRGLASAIRALGPAERAYRDLADDTQRALILAFLER